MKSNAQLILFLFALLMLGFYFFPPIQLGFSAWSSEGFRLRDDSIANLADALRNDRLGGADFGNLLIGVLTGGSFAYSTRKRRQGYTYALFALTLSGVGVVGVTYSYFSWHVDNVAEAYSPDVAAILISWLATTFRESLTFVALLAGIRAQEYLK